MDIINNKGRTIHVSGCSKGCAYAKKADITLVGNNGHIDIVINGYARDNAQASINVKDLKKLSKFI